jgi:hypothetical protein
LIGVLVAGALVLVLGVVLLPQYDDNAAAPAPPPSLSATRSWLGARPVDSVTNATICLKSTGLPSPSANASPGPPQANPMAWVNGFA